MNKRAKGLLALTAVLAMTACGTGTTSGSSGEAGPDTTASGTDAGMTTISVGVLPLVAVAPLYLGQQKGFFADEGLELNLHTSSGGAADIPSVVSGNLQFAYSNIMSVMIARDKGLDLRLVANGASTTGDTSKDATGVVVLPDSPIKSPADLAGKRVSVNTLANINDTAIRRIVESDGGDPEAINFVEIPFPDAPAALADGQVDAALIAEPFLTKALDAGARVVTYNYADTDPKLDIGGYYTTGEMVEEHPDLVQKFADAINKSLEYAQDHPDEVRDIVGTYTKIDADLRARMTLNTFRVGFNRHAAEVLNEAAVKYGTLSKPVDLDKLLPAGD